MVSASAGLDGPQFCRFASDVGVLGHLCTMPHGPCSPPPPTGVLKHCQQECAEEKDFNYALLHRPFSMGCHPYIIQNDFTGKIIMAIDNGASFWVKFKVMPL